MLQPKVMIVDDDADNRAVLCDALGSEPYTLLEAADGQHALELANREMPDLILLDVLMPGMDGDLVLHKLKEQEKTRSIPVIMVTALHSDAQVSACLDDGAVDHIRKPFSSMVVRARVRAALRSRDLAAGDKPRTPKQGRVLGFMGVKGGVGTTTIAVNVALVLCKEGREVAVAELTPYAGAIATQLGVSSSPNIEPLLRHEHPGAITSETLSRCLTNHPTGLRLLLAPPNMDEPCEMTGQQVEAIVNGLASMVDYVVLDIPSHSVMVAKAALRCCQFVAIVVEWELTSLASAPAMFKALDYWGIGGTSVGVVLIQRIPDTATMTAEYVRSHLARPLVGVIPSASDLCAQALQSGSPLVLSHPDSVCAAAFDELAERLAAEHVSAFVFH